LKAMTDMPRGLLATGVTALARRETRPVVKAERFTDTMEVEAVMEDMVKGGVECAGRRCWREV